MIERFSEADTFLPAGDPLLEFSPVGQKPSQVTEGDHGRKSGETKPFAPAIAFEPLQDFQEKILGPSIVARMETSGPEVEVPRHLERKIADRLGKGHRRLAEGDRFARITSHIVVVTKIDGHLPESASIVERLREPFGLAEDAEDPFEFPKRKQGVADIETKIDGLLLPLAGLGQGLDELQRLLKGADGLAIGRPRACQPTRPAPLLERLA